MSLHVLDPGLLTLLVDHGRPRTRHLGVPLGGAADLASLAIGNALLGNSEDCVAMEITMSGPTLRAEQRLHAVVFGAPFLAAVAGKGRMEPGVTFNLDPGEVIKIGGTPRGVRGYFCVARGIETPVILNSRSSLEPLQAGDVFKCLSSAGPSRSLGFSHLPSLHSNDTIELRVVAGTQADLFLNAEQFYAQSFEILPASNRMGTRLRGKPLERKPGEMISEAVAPGAVQVTNEGQPIVLGVDGQTIGGYPKVAHVIRADLDELAQLRTGTQVRFRLVSHEEAAAAWKEKSDVLKGWQTRLNVSASVHVAPR